MDVNHIGEALELFESLQNVTTVTEVVSNIEEFLAAPLTPLAGLWDNFAGEYFTNALGNGMFYALLAWTALYNIYAKIMNIAMQDSPFAGNRCPEISDALWYTAAHSFLLLASLWIVDPGYVGDILRLDMFGFSWRMLLNSMRIVPRSVMLVFIACSSFQIFSALQDIMQDNNRSAVHKAVAATSFIVLYCFRRLQLLLMANVSLCIYGTICEVLHVYHAISAPTALRPKVTRNSPRKVMKKLTTRPLKEMTDKYSSQLTNNRQQLQTLYDTVKGALILKRSIRRHQERKKAEKVESDDESSTSGEIAQFSTDLLYDIADTIPSMSDLDDNSSP